MKGNLYLIPTTLGDSPTEHVIPTYVKEIINKTDHYIVENERTARRYLIKAGIQKPIDELEFYLLNKHTKQEEISVFLDAAEKGCHIGVISEAGCPGVADPGAIIALNAHRKNIRVVPLTGPSSILLALMASGLDGQNFAFLGYLPVNPGERSQKLKQIEQLSFREKQTQIFMETPYRNLQMLDDILKSCNDETNLCIACDITLETEMIATKKISQWKKSIPDINKRPTIFVLRKM